MGLSNFDITSPSFEDANPFLTGLMYNRDLDAKKLANALAAVKAQYAQPMAEEGLRTEQLKNIFQNIQNQFAPDKMGSDIDLTRADTEFKRKETGLMPTRYEIEKMNALSRQKQNLNSQMNNFRQWTQTPQGQRIVMDDPNLAAAIYRQMQASSGIEDNGSQQSPSFRPNTNLTSALEAQQKMQGGEQQDNPFIAYKDAGKATGQNGLTIPTDPAALAALSKGLSQNSLGKGFSTDPTNPEILENKPSLHGNQKDIIKDIQEGAADAYANSKWPADVRKRLYAGNRYKSTVPIVMQNFESAMPYFSSSGKLQLERDEKQAALTHYVPPSLQAYRNFKQGLEQLAVQGAFLEGVPADQESRKSYGQLYDISMFFNNPQGAKESLQNAINISLAADESNRANPSSLLSDSPRDTALKKALSKSTSSGDVYSVPMINPEGKMLLVHKEDAEKAEKRGWKRR
jgi:hypothetical protein